MPDGYAGAKWGRARLVEMMTRGRHTVRALRVKMNALMYALDLRLSCQVANVPPIVDGGVGMDFHVKVYRQGQRVNVVVSNYAGQWYRLTNCPYYFMISLLLHLQYHVAQCAPGLQISGSILDCRIDSKGAHVYLARFSTLIVNLKRGTDKSLRTTPITNHGRLRPLTEKSMCYFWVVVYKTVVCSCHKGKLQYIDHQPGGQQVGGCCRWYPEAELRGPGGQDALPVYQRATAAKLR